MKSTQQPRIRFFGNAFRFTGHAIVPATKEAPTIAVRTANHEVGNGQLNRVIGWTLVTALFAVSSWFDPLVFSERNSSTLTPSLRTTVNSVRPMIAVMAFLLLAADQLRASIEQQLTKRLLSWLTGLGTMSCVVGYLASPSWPSVAGLIPGGALMVFISFALIFQWTPAPWTDLNLRIMSLMICFGMTLVAVMGLFQWDAELFLPAHLALEDGFRMRMLRLARVAAIALPVLAILYDGLAAHGRSRNALARCGRMAMIFGTMGLPLVLAGAGLTYVELKHLLPWPTLAILVGTLCGALLAGNITGSLERWGWLLIASSMAAGMIMGLYAFSVPSLPLPGLSDYNDTPRRLIRHAHIYGVLFGMAMIFLSRHLSATFVASRTRKIGVPLLAAAAMITVAVLWLHAGYHLPPAVLGIGPALAALAIVLSFGPDMFLFCRGPVCARHSVMGGES